MAARYSKDAVASHNNAGDLWVVIDEDVYDLTKFQEDHPGKHHHRETVISQVLIVP